MSPFNRCVYWDLKKAEDKRAKVAVKAQVNPELLTLKGMASVLFPIVRAQQRAQGGEEDGEQPRRKRRAESNLHSTDLWHLPGGATGDECYEIVKEKTLARRAKESEAAQRKAARAETRKSARALANDLGFNICRNLQSDADMKKLKVPELKAALMYKGVHVDPKLKLKKIELTARLAHELRRSDCSTYSQSASFVAGPSAEVEPTAADFVDSSDDAASESGSQSSEWPHSEADDH